MLRSLHLKDVGPAPELNFEFAPRLNLLTGDNGLGKSFVLDVLWYAHTWTWAGLPAWPRTEAKRNTGKVPGSNYLTSEIEYHFDEGPDGDRRYLCRFHAEDQTWVPFAPDEDGNWPRLPLFKGGAGEDRTAESPFPGNGVVIYARVDGGFSVWDSHRNRGRFPRAGSAVEDRPTSYQLSRDEVWNGPAEQGPRQYNGLIYDWVRWQSTKNGPWNRLCAVLESLSGDGVETLRPGEPMRVSINDARDIPSLQLPYGTVPITHASAGMRRICALAYMIVWAWYENKLAAEGTRSEPARDLVLLLDEVEAHLHPSWQRRVLPALMRVLHAIRTDVRVQVFAATHSPMVLASVEPTFEEEIDNLYHFNVDGQVVSAEELPFAKQGDAGNWLVSESFGLRLPRSIESQNAISAALAFMDGDREAAGRLLAQMGVPAAKRRTKKAQQDCIHALLREHVPGHDEFWPTWIVTAGLVPRRKREAKS